MKPIFEHDADSKRARDFAARWDRWFGGSTPLHLPEGVGAGGAGVDGVDGAAGRAGMTEEQREQREQRKQQQQQEDELLWQNAERNGFEIDKPVKLHVLYRDGRYVLCFCPWVFFYLLCFFCFPFSNFPFPSSLFPFPFSLFPLPFSLFPFPFSLFPFPFSLFHFPFSLLPFPFSIIHFNFNFNFNFNFCFRFRFPFHLYFSTIFLLFSTSHLRSDTYSANVVIPAHAFDEYELTFKTRSSNTYTSKLYRMEPGSQIGSGE